MEKKSCERWWGEKHDFDKWEHEVSDISNKDSDGSKRKIGQWIVQKRVCQSCGLAQFSKLRIEL